jgi:mannose-6-phosphate isomerase
MAANLYPLRFEPLFRRYLWGGRRLGTVLGKPIGEGADYAESWEVVDHGADQSRVAFGPLTGTTLGELVQERGDELLGKHHPQRQFPLLVKLLDAQQKLSVQVHPNDEQAARLDPPDLGKTEAWVVLAAEPGSRIYSGLKRGFDRPALERELIRGTCELCLHQFEPRVGDCIFLPAGTVHALGAGLMIAEVQQSSDTTYRLFDWNRVSPDGKPRALHIAQALDVIDFQQGPVDPVRPIPIDRPGVTRLVACDKFVLDRLELSATRAVGEHGRCHILLVLDGAVDLAGDPSGRPLKTGETALLPAAAGPVMLSPLGPRAVVLDAYLP